MDTTRQKSHPQSGAEASLPIRTLWYHMTTLLLFTKSDFKTIIFPQSIFAITAFLSTAKLTTMDDERDGTLLEVGSRMPHMLAWLWLNLLVEDIANQRTADSIEEDRVNKSWRPLPSQRLTPSEARNWLLAAIVIAVAASLVIGGSMASLSLMTLVWMYNDLDGSGSDAVLRNALNAGGLMCFSWGALSVLSDGELLPEARSWILVTGSIVMTTVHAQDLPDQYGDEARGRKTILVTYGEGVTRWSLAIMVIFWSVVAPAFWDASPWGSVVLLTLGSVMACLSIPRWGQRCDEVVWKLWCLWMTAIYALPAIAGVSCVDT